MSESPTKFTRRHKLFLASLATVSLSLGAAGVVSAQGMSAPNGGTPPTPQGTSSPTGASAAAPAPETPGVETPDPNEPAEASNANEATEAPSTEASDSAEELNGVDCENGINKATGAECDGGPSANPQGGADNAAEEG